VEKCPFLCNRAEFHRYPGATPRWKCDPHADTLPMTHTPHPQVSSQNVRMLIQDLTPPTPSPPRHHRRPMEALTLSMLKCIPLTYLLWD